MKYESVFIIFSILMRIIAVLLMAVVVCSLGIPDNPIENNVISLLESAGFENVKVYDSSEITLDLLENREGKTIVERCYGVVLDMETGDGRIINAADGAGNYISYRSVYQTHDENSIMLTYLVYNPENNYCDDIIIRYDFVLEKEEIK